MENIESQQIREVAKRIPNDFTVTLPSLPPEKWLNGTVENSKMYDINFASVNLADLLSYIADMVE